MTSNSPVISEKKRCLDMYVAVQNERSKVSLTIGTYIKPLSFLESIKISESEYSDLKQLFKNEHFNMSYLG